MVPSPRTAKELEREEVVRARRTAVEKTVGGKGLLETERLWGSLKVPDTKPMKPLWTPEIFLFIYALFIVVIIS